MSISFSVDELDELRLLAETSCGSSIAGVPITYGDNIEALICDFTTRNQCSLEVLQNYIEQLQLEKQFYWTCGVNEMPLIDKVVLFLKNAIEDKKITQCK